MQTLNTDRKRLWLVSATAEAVMWFFSIQKVYFRGQPLATLGLIAAVLGERIFSLLAFFLPLKVLLLAGSEGVPKYFAFFMQADDKYFWLGILAAAAVVFYLLAVILEKLSTVIAERGGEGVLREANEIHVTSLQRTQASTFFLQFATISASMALFALSLVVMGLINGWLALTLIVLTALEFAFPVLVIQRTVSRGRPVSESWMTLSWQGYLSTCRSINFLSGFGVLLAGFLLGTLGNVLWALLAIIILRQSLTAAQSAVFLLIRLYRKRPRIDPLTFRESRLVRQDRPASRDFRILFEYGRRNRLLRDVFGSLEHCDLEIHSTYRDGVQKGMYEFLVEVEGDDEFYLLNVFSSQRASLLEHENLLFGYIDRDTLKAPKVLAEFSEGPFECQLLSLGCATFISPADWESMGADVFSELCAIDLPRNLADDYLVSHQSLDERISEELVSRTVVALDTEKQRATYREFIDRISELRELIAALPVRLQNQDLVARNVALDREEHPLILNWKRWSIDRLGVIVPSVVDEELLIEVGSELVDSSKNRQFSRSSTGTELVNLVRDTVALENAISSERFNSALSQMGDILGCMDRILESSSRRRAI